MTTKNTELGLEGPGASPVSIPEIDAAAEDYIKVRDRFVSAATKLQESQDAFRALIHSHEDKLGYAADGKTLLYRYDDQIISVAPGKEKIKIKAIDTDTE